MTEATVSLKQSVLAALGVADPWEGDYQHRDFDPHGWFCRTNGWMLHKLCGPIRPEIVIEIGSWLGRSTRFLAERCKLVIAIDHWQGSAEHKDEQADRLPTLFDQFLSNCEEHKDNILPLRMSSDEAAKLPLPKADLIFIDGDHSEEAVARDIANYFPFVSERGVMCGDDYDLRMPRGIGVARAVHAFGAPNRLLVGANLPFWWYVPEARSDAAMHMAVAEGGEE